MKSFVVSHKSKKKLASLAVAMLIGFAIILICDIPPALSVLISQTPMSHKLDAPPPNAMFIFDNSGSMDWEVLISTGNQGVIGDYRYVFQNAGDNTYPGYLSYETSDSNYWKSQWSGFNSIYYSPYNQYNPWPGKSPNTTSNLTSVRSDPHNGTSTFNLTSQFGSSLIAGVSVKRAHYYVQDPGEDTNGNGVLDPGEDTNNNTSLDLGGSIYLVNFVQESGNWVRKYYRFTGPITDEQIDTNQLVALTGSGEVAGGDIPDSIKPALYEDDGVTFDRFKTDEEDLLNFSNWYTFYRRREFVAKAAVALAITRISRVNLGIYTIHSDGGTRTGVLPVKVDTNAIIVDNQDTGFSRSGSDWTTYASNSSNRGYGNNFYRTQSDANTGDNAIFRPDIPETGQYRVYSWWSCVGNNDRNARYQVTHAGGTSTLTISQRPNIPSGNPCGEWVLVGTYNFNAGTSGFVRVDNGGSLDRLAVADAMLFEPVSGLVEQDETNALLAMLYKINSNGGTPLRQALYEVGSYFDETDGITHSELGNSPYDIEDNGGHCQMSFAILMTDGFWNGTLDITVEDKVENADGLGGCPGGVPCSGVSPYSDSASNTLADVAMYFFKRDLSTTLPNEVAGNPCETDTNWQHMVTYTVSFGVSGTLPLYDTNGDGRDDDPCYLTQPHPTWPAPSANALTTVDDLRHAAVNGRGEFFSAQNPQQLVGSIVAILQAIEKTAASGSSVTANGENLNNFTVIYQARFNPAEWTGDLLAYSINPSTGVVNTSTPIWSAADEIDESIGTGGDRFIVTYDPSTENGIPFLYPSTPGTSTDGLTTSQLTALDPAWTSSNQTLAQNLVSYLRGAINELPFRPRDSFMADLIHSAPVLYDNTLYVGGNGGMLYAINATDGTERFAYVPNLVMSNLRYLADPDFEHRFYVDNSPTFRVIPDASNPQNVILVCGLGAGGQGYFALDIKDSSTFSPSDTSHSEADVASAISLWEFPRTSTDPLDIADLGMSFSRAFVVKANKMNNADPVEPEQWIAIFGNGYNSANGHAVLFVLDAMTGALIKKIDTLEGGDNGLSTPTLIDWNNDGRVDYVYAGDLRGNLWKFDLSAGLPKTGSPPPAPAWTVAFSDGTSPQPLFRAGTDQPITTKPEVMYHCRKHGFMVVFGTGKFLGDPDRSTFSYPMQSIYGVWDFAEDDEDTGYIGTISNRTLGTLSYPSGFRLLKQEEVFFADLYNHPIRVLSDFTPNYFTLPDGASTFPVEAGVLPDPTPGLIDNADNDGDGSTDESDEISHLGWFFDFPNTATGFIGERVIVDPLIREGRAIVISFSPKESECSGSGVSMVHEIDACYGGRVTARAPVFDINGDGYIDDNDLVDIDPTLGVLFVGASGIGYEGLLQPPKILRLGDTGQPMREVKLFNNEQAEMTPLFEKAEKRGIFYWIEK